MRSIQDYINEALIGKKNVENASRDINNIHHPLNGKTVTFEWPKKESCLEWETVTVRNANKYVVYNDKYHGCNHIASFGGCLEMYLFNSLEDFTPSDIIASFKTLKEAVQWAVNDAKKDDDWDQDDWDRLPNKYDREDIVSLPGYYDSMNFAKAVLSGNISDKNYDDTSELLKPQTPSRKDICGVVSYWGDVEYDYNT